MFYEDKMRKVLICLGIPASGKSTWAKEQVAKDPNLVRINRDDLRHMAVNYVHNKGNEALMVKFRDKLLEESLFSGRDVIIDDTNFGNFEKIKLLVQSFHLNDDVTIEEVPFYIELKEAIERDSKRPSPVTPPVVGVFWKKSGKESFKDYVAKVAVIPRESYPVHSEGQKAIICDLDGTLAIIGNRSPFDAKNCHRDLPNTPVVETLSLFHKQGYEILFVSGRHDTYKTQTEEFIKKHLPDLKYSLYMRKEGDDRKDFFIKKEIFLEHIYKKFHVSLVLDDRDQVVALWRRLFNLPTFQVDYGNF